MSAAHARVALGEDAFARNYAHAGMVRLDGEKMSKSLGNLVFVSKLLAAGHDPMAIRLALLAHHYRTDWDWTDAGLASATDRLATWRPLPSPPVRFRLGADAGDWRWRWRGGPGRRSATRIADDLDAPGALAVVDAWAARALSGAAAGSGPLVAPRSTRFSASRCKAARARGAADARDAGGTRGAARRRGLSRRSRPRRTRGTCPASASRPRR